MWGLCLPVLVVEAVTKYILRQLAVYGFIALIFFLWGLKADFWDSVDLAAYGCDYYLKFSTGEGDDEIVYSCYRLTGSK